MYSKKEVFRSNIERVVKNLNAMAVPRHVAEEIERVTRHNGSTLELARVIESDAILTVRVLRSINSAAYGLPRKIANIHEAVALLGFRQLSELCTDLPVFTAEQESENRHGGNRMKLWLHSLGTAVASKLIIEQLTGRSDPSIYIAGLLSNIGRNILDTFFTEQFAAALKISFEEELPLRLAEKRVFGVSSETVAYWAACSWELSESLADSLNDQYGTISAGNVWVIDLAKLLTEALGMGSNAVRFFSPFKPGLLAKNRVTPMMLEGLIELLDDAFRDIRSLYKIKGPESEMENEEQSAEPSGTEALPTTPDTVPATQGEQS